MQHYLEKYYKYFNIVETFYLKSIARGFGLSYNNRSKCLLKGEKMSFELELILNIPLFACALFAAIYGVLIISRNNTPLYFNIIVLGVECAVVGFIYVVVNLVSGGFDASSFNLSVFAYLGFLFSVFTANFGIIDSLIDDKSKELRKYRVFPRPLILLAAAVCISLFIFGKADIYLTIAHSVVIMSASMAMQYSLKHFLIPDVEGGIASCIREYNLLAFIIEIFIVAELFFTNLEIDLGVTICDYIAWPLFAALLPVLRKGIKKWNQI